MAITKGKAPKVRVLTAEQEHVFHYAKPAVWAALCKELKIEGPVELRGASGVSLGVLL